VEAIHQQFLTFLEPSKRAVGRESLSGYPPPTEGILEGVESHIY
jgi:hypothetical protein